MRSLGTVVALLLAAGAASAQEPVRKIGDEDIKQAILKKVEERLKAEHERILADVKKMLDERFPTTPAKAPGFLGISGKDVDGGVRIEQVLKDTPAAKAGLAKGDVVTAVNGKKTATMKELSARFAELGAGAKVTLTFSRTDKASELPVVLAARPQDDDDEEEDDDDGDEGDDDDGHNP